MENKPLARRLWHRYIKAPGVIRGSVSSGVQTRAGNFRAGRLPLLETVQRRWSTSDTRLPSVRPTFAHATLPDLRRTEESSAPRIGPGKLTPSAEQNTVKTASAPQAPTKAAAELPARSPRTLSDGAAEKKMPTVGPAEPAAIGLSAARELRPSPPRGAKPPAGIQRKSKRPPSAAGQAETAASTKDIRQPPIKNAKDASLFEPLEPGDAAVDILKKSRDRTASVKSAQTPAPNTQFQQAPFKKYADTPVANPFDPGDRLAVSLTAKMMDLTGQKTGPRAAADRLLLKSGAADPAQSPSSDTGSVRAPAPKGIDLGPRTEVHARPLSAATPIPKAAAQRKSSRPSDPGHSGSIATQSKLQDGSSGRAQPSPVIQNNTAHAQPVGTPAAPHRLQRSADHGVVGLPHDLAAGVNGASFPPAPNAPPQAAGPSIQSAAARSKTLTDGGNFAVQRIQRHLSTAAVSRSPGNAVESDRRSPRGSQAPFSDPLPIHLQDSGFKPLPDPSADAPSSIGQPALRRHKDSAVSPATDSPDRPSISSAKAEGPATIESMGVQPAAETKAAPGSAMFPSKPIAASEQRQPVLRSAFDTAFKLITSTAIRGGGRPAAGTPFLQLGPAQNMLFAKSVQENTMVQLKASTPEKPPAFASLQNPAGAETTSDSPGHNGLQQTYDPTFNRSTANTVSTPLAIQRRAYEPRRKIKPLTGKLSVQRDAGLPVSPATATQPFIGRLPPDNSQAVRHPWSTTPSSQSDIIFLTPAGGPQSPPAATSQRPETDPPSAMDGGPSQDTSTADEMPDLEALADAVYAIIERRLTIERESLGQ